MGNVHRGSTQMRFVEEKRMAEELHQDCLGKSRAQMIAQMSMRAAMMAFDTGRQPDRLVWSA